MTLAILRDGVDCREVCTQMGVGMRPVVGSGWVAGMVGGSHQFKSAFNLGQNKSKFMLY